MLEEHRLPKLNQRDMAYIRNELLVNSLYEDKVINTLGNNMKIMK